MRKQTLLLTTPDNHQINATLFEPEPSPNCCLIISHGMAEHGNRYAALASWLGVRMAS